MAALMKTLFLCRTSLQKHAKKQFLVLGMNYYQKSHGNLIIGRLNKDIPFYERDVLA